MRKWRIEMRHIGRGTDLHFNGVTANQYTLPEATSVVSKWHKKIQEKVRIVVA